ncbi:family 78 glycoside hydrolase catalytic domain [Nocardioides insulae]|uniref:family 78 glycoside hydrolase catalytic domain n=1 Tax=Nocardioides insulae TaxID=394734 RepID=UPI00040FC226|nr:family 78 glycoside hydrolase catalytic domain [Nocardioides insulae]
MPQQHRPTRRVRYAGLAALAVSLTAGTLATVVPASVGAAPGTAPGAPSGLVVDDVARPLNTDLTPRFGWLPTDLDGNEIQTAYEVEVRNTAGALVWDSDKVSSDQQSYVDYTGAELEPGEAYDWRVRTWDRDDQVSPWGEATFETGLGDGDWGGAEWIRRPPGNPDAATGPLRIVNGEGRVTGSTSQPITMAASGANWTDYVFSADVTIEHHAAAVVFRSPDGRNGYMWQLHGYEGQLKTHRMSNGSFPTDGRRSVDVDIEEGGTYRLSVRVEGRTITTSIDGVQVDSWTDPSSSGSTVGTIGFREGVSSSRGAEIGRFDNLEVTSLDGSEVLFSEDFSGDLSAWSAPTPTREADEYTLARTEVAVPAGEIVRARSYLSASHVAELYLDGERADRMTNYGYPGEGYYQAADITDLVRAGEDLSIGAMLHWFSNGQGRAAGEPGLLARIVVEYADGSEFVVTTNGSWKVRRGPYELEGTRNGEGLYIEHLRGDQAADIGDWKALGYDDSGWSDAVVLGEHSTATFTHLEGQQTRLTEEVVHPERILTAEDGTPVADFGVVIPARPAVHFEHGEDGREIPLRASYGLAENGRVSTSGTDTQSTNMTWPYTQADGAQDFKAFGHLGFRYLEIPGAGEEIGVEDVSATVVHTAVPDDAASTFESSDPTLDAVYDLMQRSLLYSVQETFVDTPTREQGQFLHDTVNISHGLMTSAGERVASRQAIREFMLSQARYWNAGDSAGRYNAVYPNGDGKRDIPDFTEVVPSWIWNYYLATGDRAVLEDTYDELVATAGYIRRHIAQDGPTAGLVTQLSGGSGAYQYGIVDWPMHGRFGYDMTATARTTVNALGVDVLRTVGRIAEELGKPAEEASSFSADADALAEAMNAKLRREDGVYVDGILADGSQSPHAGQHATSYAVAFGIAPAEDRPALGEYLGSMGMKQGPMTAHFLLEALADSGNGTGMLDLLTNEDDYGWAGWLAGGGTFTPEAWELSGSASSASHGWGAEGIVDIHDSALGIEVTRPGGAELRIGIPDTGLTHAEGSQVTQRGRVSSSWTHDDDEVSLTTQIPVNVTAVVELPTADGTTYEVTGPDGAEAEVLGTEEGLDRYRIGSGAWTFTRVADAVDEVRPEVSLVSPTTAGPFKQLTIQVDATDNQGLAKIVANLYQGNTLIKSTQTPIDGATAATHTATITPPEGTYTLKYNAHDQAGNISQTGTTTLTIDTTAPTATIKDGTTYTKKTGQTYDLISFKLHDTGKIDKLDLNGTVKDLSNNTWSDLNYIQPGRYGAHQGTNTLTIHDLAGNTTTYTFTLN